MSTEAGGRDRGRLEDAGLLTLEMEEGPQVLGRGQL